MKIDGANLCDFCFKSIPEGTECLHCGLSHSNYNRTPGLLAPGTVLIDKYIIGKTIGRGGFGATYLAYSYDKKKPVAIKEYLPMSIACRANDETAVSIISEDKRDIFEKGARRFYDEAQTIYGFGYNPNIVSVYEFFYANNTAYFSMEYLEGSDLKKYIDKQPNGRLDEREAVYIFSKVCKALEVVHAKKMLHRDISPDNIFICSSGDIKLIDFGSARQYVTDGTTNFSVIVKRGFAPAEQYLSNGKQGEWTDIYALGASLYYSVTGKMPPEALSMIETGMVFDNDIYISAEVKNIIDKCLRYKIEERYRNVDDLRKDLESVLTSEIPVIDNDDFITQKLNDDVSDDSNEENRKKSFIDISDKTTKYILYAIAGLLVCLIIVFSISIFDSRSNRGQFARGNTGGGDISVMEFGPLGQETDVSKDNTESGTNITNNNGDTNTSKDNVKPKKKIDFDKIKHIIDKHCRYTDFGVYVKNSETDYVFSYNADNSLLASAMSQVVVLDVVARAVDKYGIDIEGDAFEFNYIPNGKEAPDSKYEDGTLVSVQKCVEDVAVYGDNNKSNLFIDYIAYLYDSDNPFGVVNGILYNNGYKETSVNRRIMTNPNYVHESSEYNMTSAAEIADIFEHLIYCGSFGSPDYMKGIFKSVSLDGEPIGLKEYLPSYYNVCNANGLSAQATNNVAIISKGDTEIVVSILAVTKEAYLDDENYEDRESAVYEIINYIVESQF